MLNANEEISFSHNKGDKSDAVPQWSTDMSSSSLASYRASEKTNQTGSEQAS